MLLKFILSGRRLTSLLLRHFIFNHIKLLPVDEDLESSEVPKKTPSRRNLFKWTSLNLDEADDETKTNASGEL